jgi:glucose/arabinose dehydrogenase
MSGPVWRSIIVSLLNRSSEVSPQQLPGRARLPSYTKNGMLLLWMLLTGVACGAGGTTSDVLGTGPDPVLPPPHETRLPTVNIAPAVGWRDDATPVAAEGLTVNAFAADLQHPRWLYLLPNGDVLVAETNAPARPQDGQGLRGWLAKRLMKRAGAAVPSGMT